MAASPLSFDVNKSEAELVAEAKQKAAEERAKLEKEKAAVPNKSQFKVDNVEQVCILLFIVLLL